MYRLLATDIDDTLLGPDGSLPEVNRTVLRRLHVAGVAIVFSSGRADVSIRAVAAGIVPPDDTDYLISFNGSRVVTADTRRVIHQTVLTREMVTTIVSYARAHRLYIQAYADDEFLVEEENVHTRAYAAATGMAYRVVPDLVEAASASPKLLILDHHEVLLPHREALSRLGAGDGGGIRAAGGAVIAPARDGRETAGAVSSDAGFIAMFSKPRYLEIVRMGVSKGAALTALAARLGIPMEETIALGDSTNDIEMIEAAGLGVAVANARAELKERADVVLETDAADGVMAEVERRFFGEG